MCRISLESSVVVACWSHIALVPIYHGRLIPSSILNDSFAGWSIIGLTLFSFNA
jgi:hypothetical protein